MILFKLISFCFSIFSAQATLVYQQIPYDSKLNELLYRCDANMAVYFESIAMCPEVLKFKFNYLDKKNMFLFLKDLNLDLQPSNAKSAFAMIKSSTAPQLDSLKNTGEKKVAKIYQKATNALKPFLKKAEKAGLDIQIDRDTTWFPKVKARAAVIIDRKHSTITVIRHGDAEG